MQTLEKHGHAGWQPKDAEIEHAIINALARHPRQSLTRDKLAQLARGREFEPFDRSLDVQISRLRKMIELDPASPKIIQTVWGVGYVFVPD
jgi:two-component system phosphate regulon response regulator OmpR